MVGSACLRKFLKMNFKNLIIKDRDQLDLTNKIKTSNFFHKYKPDVVILAAAKVGGIIANRDNSYEFILNNLEIQNNVINSAHESNVGKFIFLGSSCVYPKLAKQPINESSLLNGFLEPTNRAYALAKIAGIEMCSNLNKLNKKNFFSIMPCNLYGPNDNYDLTNSHVLPAVIKKIHNCKINKLNEVEIWGTGKVKREFMYVDDLAEAIFFLLSQKKSLIQHITKQSEYSLINIGSSEEITIYDLYKKVSKILNYNGKLKINPKYPDGTPRKILDNSIINSLGWRKKIDLNLGIKMTYEDFLKGH